MADRLDVDGLAAPPRDNGELVFAAPWQGRAFAVTVALHQDGRFRWDDFRDELIAELAAAADAGPDTYWAAWLRATEAILDRHRLVSRTERADRLAAYTARPTDHDHGHDAHHHHDPGQEAHHGPDRTASAAPSARSGSAPRR